MIVQITFLKIFQSVQNSPCQDIHSARSWCSNTMSQGMLMFPKMMTTPNGLSFYQSFVYRFVLDRSKNAGISSCKGFSLWSGTSPCFVLLTFFLETSLCLPGYSRCVDVTWVFLQICTGIPSSNAPYLQLQASGYKCLQMKTLLSYTHYLSWYNVITTVCGFVPTKLATIKVSFVVDVDCPASAERETISCGHIADVVDFKVF